MTGVSTLQGAGPPSPRPAGRYGHTASAVDATTILVFGGVLGPSADSSPFVSWDNENLSSELWAFDLASTTWLSRASDDVDGILPRIAGHSATLVGERLVILGGRTRSVPFLHDVLE